MTSQMRGALLIATFSIFNFQFSICAHAQTPPPPTEIHDITQVDIVEPGSAAATPLPGSQRRRLKRYEIPELAGARQALGSQLIDGRLRKPVLDFYTVDGVVEQRISFFEGGLVVVRLQGAGGRIRKRVLLPDDAMKSYLAHASPAALRAIDERELTAATKGRRSLLRVYDADGSFVEREYQPGSVLPKVMQDEILPLQDLLRAISEDRTVTSTVAGYEPQPGDELVADDNRVYRVMRVVNPSGVVELKCLTDPTLMYVAKKDLAEYFVGRAK